MLSEFLKLSSNLSSLVDADPALAVQQAREMDLDRPDRVNWMSLRAAILVNAGASLECQDAIDEGVNLYRELHSLYPTTHVTYNLANALVEAANCDSADLEWVDHQEHTRAHRTYISSCHAYPLENSASQRVSCT